MNKVREINIETDDLEYGHALARSLGMHYKGMCVKLSNCNQELERQADAGDYFTVNGKQICKYMNVHAIAGEIERAISGLDGDNGHSLFARTQILQETLSIGIVGMRGGCGVSSIAEGLARTFTLFHGRRVLLVTFSNFGPEYFESKTGSELKPIDRLMYESEVLSDTDFEERISSYVMPDEYGVWQLGLRKGYNPLNLENAESTSKLIEDLIAKLNINLTIFDFGSASSMGQNQMRLLSKMDMSFAVLDRPDDRERAADFSKIVSAVSGIGDLEFEFNALILNDCTGGHENAAGEAFHFLGYSPESFGQRLDLGLEFGIGLEKIAANCEKYQTIP